MAQLFPYQFMTAALGAVAVTVTLGAAQLASGSDLKPLPSSETVNRDAKTDRMTVRIQAEPSQTVAVHLQGQADSSILVRIPGPVGDTRTTRNAPRKAPVSTRRTAIACEPVVSVLTEAAKLLEPGRCIT